MIQPMKRRETATGTGKAIALNAALIDAKQRVKALKEEARQTKSKLKDAKKEVKRAAKAARPFARRARKARLRFLQ